MSKSPAPERKPGCSDLERLHPELMAQVLGSLGRRPKAALRQCSSTLCASVNKVVTFINRGEVRRGDGGR